MTNENEMPTNSEENLRYEKFDGFLPEAENDPFLAGKIATPMYYFGEKNNYVIYGVHQEGGEILWKIDKIAEKINDPPNGETEDHLISQTILETLSKENAEIAARVILTEEDEYSVIDFFSEDDAFIFEEDNHYND